MHSVAVFTAAHQQQNCISIQVRNRCSWLFISFVDESISTVFGSGIKQIIFVNNRLFIGFSSGWRFETNGYLLRSSEIVEPRSPRTKQTQVCEVVIDYKRLLQSEFRYFYPFLCVTAKYRTDTVDIDEKFRFLCPLPLANVIVASWINLAYLLWRPVRFSQAMHKKLRISSEDQGMKRK